MAASKVVETVILGAGTLIVIYYAVTHQDQLKMYFDKFVMSAKSQLNAGGSSTATGANTSGSDNTPATTTTTPATSTTPAPAAPIVGPAGPAGTPGPTGPPGPPVTIEQIKAAFPDLPTKLLGTVTPPSPQALNQTVAMMRMQQMRTDAAANQLASTILPPSPQALNQTVMMQQMAMMQQQTDAAANKLASTITPVDPSLVNNTGMPSIVGQTPQTTTGRNMKQMMKMTMPRVQTAAQKKAGQITSAKQKGNVIVPATMANQFCVCTTAGRWSGPGCNQANKFCAMAGAHGTGK